MKGEIEVWINDSMKKNLGVGSSFGELALLFNAPRSASIKCVGNCGFWAINRATFRKTVEEMMMKDLPFNREFMNGVQFFNFLTNF